MNEVQAWTFLAIQYNNFALLIRKTTAASGSLRDGVYYLYDTCRIDTEIADKMFDILENWPINDTFWPNTYMEAYDRRDMCYDIIKKMEQPNVKVDNLSV